MRPPGRWGRLAPPAKPANQVEVTTESTPSPSPSASACLPFHEWIEVELGKGRNAMAIWQDLVDRHAPKPLAALIEEAGSRNVHYNRY